MPSLQEQNLLKKYSKSHVTLIEFLETLSKLFRYVLLANNRYEDPAQKSARETPCAAHLHLKCMYTALVMPSSMTPHSVSTCLLAKTITTYLKPGFSCWLASPGFASIQAQIFYFLMNRVITVLTVLSVSPADIDQKIRKYLLHKATTLNDIR